ncbi:hypothetical protein SIPHO063v1_p0066 [Vibrio phage PS10B.1]|nr:hypothetical protein SIPHO063v1_p0066 [Vibrio phage PS10B.1]
MPVKVSHDEYVAKAVSVHGCKYDYLNTSYVNSRTKINVNCPEHGGFSLFPGKHLQGNGCPKCATFTQTITRSPSLTHEEFVDKAHTIHGDRYCYSGVVYVRSSDKVTIKCSRHGPFEQTPTNHLQDHGCPECADTGRLTTEEFIKKARDIHGVTYDYSNTEYKNARTRITVVCKRHGVFSILPSKHLQGNRCPVCSDKRLSSSEFTDKAHRVHGFKYQFSKMKYIGTHVKITITCPHHGDFEQTPASHLQGKGCPSCSVYGFNPEKRAYVYVLIDSDTFSQVKIGITNTPDKRLTQLENYTPFSIERIDLFETPPEITLLIEKFCHSQMESSGLRGFDGATEWFKFDGGKLEALRKFIKSCGGRHV